MYIKNNLVVNALATRCVLAFFACVASACSPVNILNTLVPTNNYQLVSAVSFGELNRQKLDIYLPKNQIKSDKSLKKVIIFYYGGNWDSGERADYKFVGEALSAQGFIVVIPDYRVYPDVLFPAFMADPANAAKWVKDNIHQYGGDANKVFLAGHSAGAHIAVMLALNAEYLAKQHLTPHDFVGVIGLAGPYDFLPLKADRLKTIFGSETEQWKSQPINFVDGKNPPILLAVGRKDNIVAPYNTDNLAKKIKQNYGLVEVSEFASYSHVDMVAKLAKPLRGDGALLKTITTFVDKN